jgi:hypothetical protein
MVAEETEVRVWRGSIYSFVVAYNMLIWRLSSYLCIRRYVVFEHDWVSGRTPAASDPWLAYTALDTAMPSAFLRCVAMVTSQIRTTRSYNPEFPRRSCASCAGECSVIASFGVHQAYRPHKTAYLVARLWLSVYIIRRRAWIFRLRRIQLTQA